jgi:hypothetical protein
MIKQILFVCLQKALYLKVTQYYKHMTKLVHRDRYDNDRLDLPTYSHMCEECGVAFQSLEEYIGHYKEYHPRSIGTAIT